eukprot:TRINITY_DN5504_c0_g2_i8.p1 TRINITY_DN5504_c0_g2~~TRINITY_DN5504_c0_g2_i8.p1  ORF type:complete len:865 (+),score=66.13 TRINITY_DN5504_c0_g2_i8:239-2833(+)
MRSVNPDSAFPHIPDVPTFHPTEEQFKDPWSFISSIYEVGSRAGACVIVPPEKWNPKFSVPENMTFSPATQSIAQLCSRTVRRDQFMSRLRQHNRKHQLPVPHQIFVGDQELDLVQLHKEIRLRGGLTRVNDNPDHWIAVATAVGCSQQVPVLETMYMKYLDSYARELDSLDPIAPAKKSSREKCSECDTKNHPNSMIRCSGCDLVCHMFCILNPPDGTSGREWFCSKCVQRSTTNVFPIRESQCLYSCETFEEVARSRKENYFGKPENEVSIREVEKAYWNELGVQYGSEVEVEYGNDLPTNKHGSGFPSVQPNAKKQFGQDWYFDQLIKNRGNLLRTMSDQISGITNPWLYIAQYFSTFCWHNEDSHLFSLNYMHKGKPKIWYTVPASNADKFAEVMKLKFPELFAAYPNALFQLCTMINPSVLINHGVEVYRGVQQPGSFIVTFPKAYHGGFSTGFNCAEAVNFALPEWLPFANDCKRLYREEHHFSPVCIEQVVLNEAISRPQSSSIAHLKECLLVIVGEEQRLRAQLAEAGATEFPIKTLPGRRTLEDGQHKLDQCAICRQDLYMSFVTCKKAGCKERKVCLHHAYNQCGCEMETRQLYYRYTAGEFKKMIDVLEEPRSPILKSEPPNMKCDAEFEVRPLKVEADDTLGFELEIMESDVPFGLAAPECPGFVSKPEVVSTQGPTVCQKHVQCSLGYKHKGLCRTAPVQGAVSEVKRGNLKAASVKRAASGTCPRHAQCDRGYKHGGHCRLPASKKKAPSKPLPPLDHTESQRSWKCRTSKLLAVAVCTEIAEESKLSQRLGGPGKVVQQTSDATFSRHCLAEGCYFYGTSEREGYCTGCYANAVAPSPRKRKHLSLIHI